MAPEVASAPINARDVYKDVDDNVGYMSFYGPKVDFFGLGVVIYRMARVVCNAPWEYDRVRAQCVYDCVL